MIVYFYTPIDNLEQILAFTPQGTPRIRLEARHRSFLSDDPQSIFGRYILPRCLKDIERELDVKPENSLIPLINNREFMEAIFNSIKTFNDRELILSQFVVSFYENMDQLDLWMRYADRGRGIAIGFDTDLIREPFGQVFNFSLQKCIYWPKEVANGNYNLDNSLPIYSEIKEVYQSMSDPRISESFKKMYSQDGPEFIVARRLKETILHNLITTFDLFQKNDDWQEEKEHRMAVCAGGAEIHYKKDNNGDYIPYVSMEFSPEALKIIMIGPKCGRYTYGMIRSLLFDRKIKQQVQVLNSSNPM